MRYNSYQRLPHEIIIANFLKIQKCWQAFVKKLSFQTWTSEVTYPPSDHQHLKASIKQFIYFQRRMRNYLKIIQKNIFVVISKDLTLTHVVVPLVIS